MFFEPIYIPWALNTETCIKQGDPFYSAGLHRNHVIATANAGKTRGEGGWKNAGEWTGRVEISQEEIPGWIIFIRSSFQFTEQRYCQK